MENKFFNRELSAEMILQDFVVAYTHGRNITEQYSKFLSKINEDNKPENIESNIQRRKIIEKCRDLFKDFSKKKALDEKIAQFRNETMKNTGIQPTDSEITKMILQTFSDAIWGDGKRKYNMSQIASKGMVNNVVFVPFNSKNNDNTRPPRIRLRNKSGDSIVIEYMGCLHYDTLSTNEYLYKHRIYRDVDKCKNIYEIFSNLDINQLPEDNELRYVVFTELLSKNNIENSYADGYIGEISTTENSKEQLKTGKERMTSGFYRYQVTSKYALEYNGERIEAIRTYKQQEANKNSDKILANDDGRED